jgi:hypothetical protein
MDAAVTMGGATGSSVSNRPRSNSSQGQGKCELYQLQFKLLQETVNS